MLSSTASTAIQNANSVKMSTEVSAEWNYNVFMPPYLTVAGNGTKIAYASTTGLTISSASVTKENFTTKQFTVASGGSGSVGFNVTSGLGGKAYKIITYMRTNSPSPIIVNTYGTGTSANYSGASEELSSFGWTRVEAVIGSTSAISSFTYNINVKTKTLSEESKQDSFTVYFTDIEIYETTDFDYQNSSLWPTDSVFSNFRPGESYVGTGKTEIAFPTNYRKLDYHTRNGDNDTSYLALTNPISRVMFNPRVAVFPPDSTATRTTGSGLAANEKQNPLLKNGMISSMSPYKYFVSDITTKKISAVYEKDLYVNKIVLKFNTIITTPTVTVSMTNAAGTTTTVSGAQPDDSGLLVLYWNNSSSAWSTSKIWNSSTMPTIAADGSIPKTNLKKITVEQTSSTFKTEFNNSKFNTNTEFSSRMQVIEISPRLELDLSSFLLSVGINKTLDNKSSALPISSIESNDASIQLSGIPNYNNGNLIPIFSNDSNNSNTVLAKMLRKYVKFYINHKIELTSAPGSTSTYSSEYVPAGVFYSDAWTQNDIDSVSIQCFDITRYLQSVQIPDYVAQFFTVEEIISNLLDLSGFTDYDYTSLYNVTHNYNVDMNLGYYFANSKDTTVFDALRKIFGAYQIAAYIDEYGIMKFTSLSNILSNQTTSIEINDFHIESGGYSLTTKAKPGKISLRYAPPKISTSQPAHEAVTQGEMESPSFFLTTQNDIVWEQQNADSLGFNYLSSNMSKDSSEFSLNPGDLLDFFHTFSRDYDGYAIIEDEIVSFKYKEYILSKADGTIPETVSIKNNIELQAKINQYVKTHQLGSGTRPIDGVTTTDYYPYDIKVTPTGKIVNVQRGLFGTKVKDHNIISDTKNITNDLASKGLVVKQMTGNIMATLNSTVAKLKINNSTIQTIVSNDGTNPVLIYPSSDTDNGYKTYSTTFALDSVGVNTTAGVFFNATSTTSLTNSVFVGLLYNANLSTYSVTISQHNGTTLTTLYTADVTKIFKSIIANTPQVFKLDTSYFNDTPWLLKYKKVIEPLITLKVVRDDDEAANSSMDFPAIGNIQTGNTGTKVIRVFLNNEEVKGWGILSGTTVLRNATLLPVSPAISNSGPSVGSIFGAFIRGGGSTAYKSAVFTRELYASTYALNEASDPYFHKTQYFLNGIANGLKFTDSSYMMQTKPAASGLNYYDIQYTTPAATVVDVLPVQYKMIYQPTAEPLDTKYRQTITILDNNAKYSTPVNTGFRAKMMIANNSPFMVFLKKEGDATKTTTAALGLNTMQVITTSDERVIEKEIDRTNASEIIQIDSQWIQSEDSALGILGAVEAGLEGFSKDVSIRIFGNPLIQVGDVINLNYSLAGIVDQKYVVHSVSQSFDGGLSTSLIINKI